MQNARIFLRLARRFQAVYEERFRRQNKHSRSDWDRLSRCFQEILHRRQGIEKAQAHGWRLAAYRLEQQLSALLLSLSQSATQLRENGLWRPPQVPPLQDLFAELEHLQEEFSDVVLDRKRRSIAVSTGEITLEGTELGSFSIEFHWSRLLANMDIGCFEIVALEPHPAASDENVTHPHVKDQSLCAGDATVPLQKALEQGRIVDAFCLIRSVLETYNARSAYTSLADWNGVSCWNCSDVADRGELSFCEYCEHDVCSECTSSCKQCDRSFCTSCQSRCAECDLTCCRHCLKTSVHAGTACCADCLRTCAGCGARVASSEQDEVSELCPTCFEEPTGESCVPAIDVSPTIPTS